ncbi:MAG: hypothetical protein ACREJC_01495 [Tepidisphaeraceae bacterium]
MDVSKLPKLSQTDPPPPVEDHTPQPGKFQSSTAAEIWLPVALGVILLLMYPRWLQWATSRIFGTRFSEFMLDGAVVPYQTLPDFWSDLGTTSFGIVLIVEGIALALSRSRHVLWFSFGLICAATGYNFIWLIVSFSKHGLAIISAFAVVFGVYIAMSLWSRLSEMR